MNTRFVFGIKDQTASSAVVELTFTAAKVGDTVDLVIDVNNDAETIVSGDTVTGTVYAIDANGIKTAATDAVMGFANSAAVADDSDVDLTTDGKFTVKAKEDEKYYGSKITLIAFDEDAKLKAFGNEAFAMYEKQPYSIHVVKPMEHGVISDYTNMRYLLGTVLDHYFKRIRKTGLMIAVPVDITNVEKRAFEDLAWESASRVKDVTLVPKPILAAIGSGIDVNAPCGNMIIDIGASTTEISVISLGGIVTSRLLPYGGDQIDEWIRDYVKKNYKLAIGTRSARHLKLAYAKIEDKEAAMIKGRDLVSGLPKQERYQFQIVEEKAHSQVRDICVQVKAVLESITPELASDIMNQGIYVSGGGAAFPKTAEWIKEEFKIPVHIADRPEDHVILGMQSYLKR